MAKAKAKKRKSKSRKRSEASKKAWRARRRNGTASVKRKKPGHRRHKVKGFSYKRKGSKKRVHVKAHMSHEMAAEKKRRPGHHWVKGHTTKKGVHIKGHWVKNAKRHGGKRKGGGHSAKRGVSLKRQLEMARKRLTRLQAEGKSQKQIAAAARRLRNLSARKDKQIHKKEEQLKMLRAAERGRHHGKRKKHRGRHSRRRNPIDGMGQNLAAAGGALTGILLTVVPYRLIRSHKLAAAGQGQGGAGMIDQPAQGDVPNLSTAQLPFYARMKWKGAIALGVYILGDVVLPFTAAHMADRHPKTKSFFQVWGWTAVALGGTKAVVDVAAMAMKSTAIGQRLFAPENTARTLRAMSANAPLPAISVAPGLGLPGLTGYGKPATGAGCGCGGNCGTCADCKAKAGQPAQPGNLNAGGSAPAPTTSVPGSAPASMTGAGNPPPAAPAPAEHPKENIVIQGHFAPKPTPPGRFSAKRFT